MSDLERIETAEKFLELTRNSKTLFVGPFADDRNVIFITIHFYSEDDNDTIAKTYIGPDPYKTDFATYMKFLAELYSVPGLQSFIKNYTADWFRRMGRMFVSW